LDHPHIAQVYDAGVSATGRPYFVMELVRGIKITDFRNQSRLTNRRNGVKFLAASAHCDPHIKNFRCDETF
jgi:serine/threonine protein kinase